MKTSLYLLLLLLPSSLYSVRHLHLVINNQSEDVASIFYKRTDPGFSGQHSVITDTITVAHNEIIEIEALKRKSRKSSEKYTLIICIVADQKPIIQKLNKEKTNIKILKDKTLEIS